MILNRNALKKKPDIGIKEFNSKKNKILVLRKEGGWGDILMHRMLFQDIKSLLPKSHITFACPSIYHNAVKDHPFIDEITDCRVDTNDFLYVYDTTAAELKTKSQEHKVDIWAESMGLKLTNHNMFLRGRNVNDNNVLLAPFSAMPSKSLSINQVLDIKSELKDFNIKIIHNKPVKGLDIIYNLSFVELIELYNNITYVITVDTSHLHIAGGMNKQTIGIFGWTDGKTMCKYYRNVKILQVSEPTTTEKYGCLDNFTIQKYCPLF